jgi:hypothetical protein
MHVVILGVIVIMFNMTVCDVLLFELLFNVLVVRLDCCQLFEEHSRAF